MPAKSGKSAAGRRGGEPAREVESIAIQAARRLRIPQANAAKRRAIYNTQLEVVGLPLPELRAINRAGFSFYSESEKSLLAAWGAVWSGSDLFEAKIQPLLYYEGRLKSLDAKIHWPVLKAWAPDIDNWEHSDRFSKIFARLLEISPGTVYPTLRKWNRSKQAWLRRQSIVSLLCYDNLRERRPPVGDILPLVENLLADPDVYVQKGVGWTLRETGRAYPGETLAFLYDHIRELRPVAFSAATEKIGKSDKQKLKDLRK